MTVEYFFLIRYLINLIRVVHNVMAVVSWHGSTKVKKNSQSNFPMKDLIRSNVVLGKYSIPISFGGHAYSNTIIKAEIDGG